MAQAGFTPIQLYHTSTALAVPSAGNMVQGELALNITDGKLYFKNASNNVTLLAVAGGAGSGTVTNVAASGGTTGLTFSGSPITTTGTLTLGGTLGTNNGGTGQTTYTDGQLLIGNTSTGGLTKTTLTAGSGISITNGSGSITIAATGGGGGSVSSVTATFPATSSGGATPDIGIAHSGGACTTTTGTGSLVFSNSPTLTTPNLGTPSAINIVNATGLTSNQVTNALGFTPYNSTNPAGYVNSSGSVAFATNAGNASTVTNGVYTNNTQTITGAKTFSSLTSGGTTAVTMGSATPAGTGINSSAYNFTAGTSIYRNNNTNGDIVISNTGSAQFTFTPTGIFVAPGSIVSSAGSFNFSSTTSWAYNLSNTVQLAINSGAICDFYQSGDMRIYGSNATKASGTTWANPSDIRLKNNIQNYTSGISKLMQVQPKTWEYNGKAGTLTGTKGLGVIADEIEQVLPNAVDTYKAKLNKDDATETDIKRFDATEITWLLVNSVKELKAELDAAKAEIQALKAK